VNTEYKIRRRRRIFELRCEGKTIDGIAKLLKKEGFTAGVTTRSIYNDMRSDYYRMLVAELQRRQLADLHEIQDVVTRLRWRQKLLETITPRQVLTNQEGDGSIKILLDGLGAKNPKNYT